MQSFTALRERECPDEDVDTKVAGAACTSYTLLLPPLLRLHLSSDAEYKDELRNTDEQQGNVRQEQILFSTHVGDRKHPQVGMGR